MLIISPEAYSRSRPPPPGAVVQHANRLSKPLLYAWLMNEGGGGKSFDGFRRGRDITWTSMGWGPGPHAGLRVPMANGTSSQGAVTIDLSGTNVFTLSVYFYWDTYANDDDFLMELTTTVNSTVNGFYVDPNAADGSFTCNMRGAAGYNSNSVSRPAARVWHHLVLVFDKTVTSGPELTMALLDGRLVTITPVSGSQANNSENFANDQLNLFRRHFTNNLFGAGRMHNLMFFNGALSLNEALLLYSQPYFMWKRPPVVVKTGFAAGGGTTTGTKTLASGARLLYTATKTLASGARLLFTATKTLASGARLTQVATKTLASGARLNAVATKTLASGARLNQALSLGLASGARLRTTPTLTLASGARLRYTATATLASGARLRFVAPKDLASGARLLLTRTVALASGAALQGSLIGTKTLASGARLRYIASLGLTSGARLRFGATVALGSGARLRTVPAVTLVSGAHVRFGALAALASGTRLLAVRTVALSSGASLEGENLATKRWTFSSRVTTPLSASSRVTRTHTLPSRMRS